jgi:type IV pilus assembly protein PilV
MTGRRSSPIARRRTQRGFSMLEILVTLFLITMWLLASAGVQSSSLQYSKAAQFRTQAVYLATELSERMQANTTAAITGRYAISGTVAAAGTNCTTAACSSDGLAAFDIAEWSARVAATLPSGTATVTPRAVANPITYDIVINWSDRRTDRTYSTTGSAESFSYTAVRTVYNNPGL